MSVAGPFWRVAHGLVFGITAVYYLAMILTIWPRPNAIKVPFVGVVSGIFELSVLLTITAIVIQRFAHMVFVARPERPIAHFSEDLTTNLIDTRCWATGVPITLAMLPFMYVYTIFKYNIPVLAPFSWDATFEFLGRALHFGSHPWQWLAPVLSNVVLTTLLSANYILWCALLWGMTVALGFSGRNDEHRTRFFVTFMLIWSIGGTLLAILFSSAGPCFWQQLKLPGMPYSGIMDNLHRSNSIFPLVIVHMQNALWEGYTQHRSVAGISAMPSMHNATALLLALAAARYGPLVAALMWTHCVLVFIGSIWLGWHYAVDGYVAFAITGFFWWLSKPIAAWWHSLHFVKNFDSALAELPLAR